MSRRSSRPVSAESLALRVWGLSQEPRFDPGERLPEEITRDNLVHVRNPENDDLLLVAEMHRCPPIPIPDQEYAYTNTTVGQVSDVQFWSARETWEHMGYTAAYQTFDSGHQQFLALMLAAAGRPVEDQYFRVYKENQLVCLHMLVQPRRNPLLNNPRLASPVAESLREQDRQAFLQLMADQKVDHFTATEINALRAVRHPNVICMINSILIGETRCLYQLMEFCDAGCLQDLIKQDHSLGEAVTRYFMRQIVRGVNALHQSRIAHRDLRPQNMLLRRKGAHDLVLKIAGFHRVAVFAYYDPKVDDWRERFGKESFASTHYTPPEGWLAKNIKDPRRLFHAISTRISDVPQSPVDQRHHVNVEWPPHNVPRPVITAQQCQHLMRQSFLPRADVFAIGVTFYVMMTGTVPYPKLGVGGVLEQGLDLLFRGEAVRSAYYLNDLSWNVFRLLTNPDPEQRPSLEQVLQTPSFSDANLPSQPPPHPFPGLVLKDVHQFRPRYVTPAARPKGR